MLRAEEFKDWCVRNKISEKAEDVITSIRKSPSRTVGGGNFILCRRAYPSEKMGVLIRCESYLELTLVKELENDNDVLEYYGHPNPIKFKSNMIRQFKPDFFVIRRNSAGWVECETESKLIGLQVHAPNRLIRNDDGLWICPPGENYASQFGLYYRLWSDFQADWVLQKNMRELFTLSK